MPTSGLSSGLTHREHDRSSADALVHEVAAWDAAGLYLTGLHAGDIGWALRLTDSDLEGSLHGWWDGDRLAAVVFLDGAALVRPRFAPDRSGDEAAVGAVVALVESLFTTRGQSQLWVDADAGTRLRQDLVGRGWDLDPDPWVALYRDLTQAVEDPEAEVRRAAEDVAARVTAHREGFENSTFDEAGWERMAAGPGYEPSLDLVALTDAGEPAAVATAWLSVPGGTAVLEPVATSRRHRRAGLGRAVVQAACAAAREAGASGISVCTPAANEAAVAAYRAAGLRPMETFQAVTLAR